MGIFAANLCALLALESFDSLIPEDVVWYKNKGLTIICELLMYEKDLSPEVLEAVKTINVMLEKYV